MLYRLNKPNINRGLVGNSLATKIVTLAFAQTQPEQLAMLLLSTTLKGRVSLIWGAHISPNIRTHID